MKVAREQPRANLWGCDGNRREETLVTVREQRTCAKSLGVVAEIIELAVAEVWQARHEAETAQRAHRGTPPPHSIGPALAVVSEEQLVAAFTAQHDLHVARCGPRKVPQWNSGIGCGRFVERALHRGEDVSRCFRLDRQHHMLAADALGDGLGSG